MLWESAALARHRIMEQTYVETNSQPELGYMILMQFPTVFMLCLMRRTFCVRLCVTKYRMDWCYFCSIRRICTWNISFQYPIFYFKWSSCFTNSLFPTHSFAPDYRTCQWSFKFTAISGHSPKVQ